jgi:hypothetical protein
MKNKHAAFEMSVGTIVTIVLSVTLLILGVVFVQQIFSSAKGVADLTDQQMRNEINKLFSSEDEIVIYPSTRKVEIKQTEGDDVGFGIKNLESKEDSYTYSITANPGTNCPDSLSKEEAMSWIILGDSEQDIGIESGGFVTRRISFEIPTGAPLCSVRYSLAITSTNGRVMSDSFDIVVKAK